MNRRGFTLVELLVAVSVGALVLLGARLVLAHVGDGAGRILREARAADAQANAERLLRRTVGQLEVGTYAGSEFAGTERGARFSAWCEVPDGWLERCRVTLALVEGEQAQSLVLELACGPRPVAEPGPCAQELVVLRRGIREGALRYLERADAGGTWIREWGAGVTAPIAIGIITDADTLIVRIGARG